MCTLSIDAGVIALNKNKMYVKIKQYHKIIYQMASEMQPIQEYVVLYKGYRIKTLFYTSNTTLVIAVSLYFV